MSSTLTWRLFCNFALRYQPFRALRAQSIEYKPYEGFSWVKIGTESEETFAATNRIRDEILKGNPIFKDTRGTTHASDIGGREVVVLTNFPRAKLAVRGNHYHPVKTESFTYRRENPAYVILATLTKTVWAAFKLQDGDCFTNDPNIIHGVALPKDSQLISYNSAGFTPGDTVGRRGNQPLSTVQEFDVMNETMLRHFFSELRDLDDLV